MHTTNSSVKKKLLSALLFASLISVSWAEPTNTPVSLAEALDTQELVWTSSGSAPWLGQSLVTHDGVDAVQSGPITHSASSSFETVVAGPRSLTYWWKVSCETNSDRLSFYVDGSAQAMISGEVNWQQRTVSVPSGLHVLKWTYSKNAALSAGQDRGWIDLVQFSGSGVCVATISLADGLHGIGSETGIVSVATSPDCAWTVSNTNPWVSVASATNGMGNGVVRYIVAANPLGLERTGLLTIAGQNYTITQLGETEPGPCTYSISPASFTHGPASATNFVILATQPGCVWNVVNTNTWVFIKSASSGDGSATVSYTIAANPNPSSRSGTINIAGQNFVITQIGAACTFALSASSSIHDSAAATGEVNVFAAPGCAWTVFNTNAWVSLLSGSNVGSGTVLYSLAANSAGATRIGNLRVAGQLFTVTQTGGSSPCSFSISPGSQTHSSTSSTGLVAITSSPGCSWAVVNTNPWVSIVSGSSGTGNGMVRYILSANPMPATRSGSLLIADQIFSITQLGLGSTNGTMPLGEALDASSLLWSTTGVPAWFGQSSVSHDGLDAAQSGAVAHNAAVTVQTTVNGPGTISFWWKVSSELSNDFLKFFINGSQQSRISGEVDWEAQTYAIPSGSQMLKWTYAKSASGSAGLDKGWLDQVQFLSTAGGCVVTISHNSATHSSHSETGQVNIVAAPGCTWGVVNTNSWITHVVGVGDSNGFVRYALAANNSVANRTGVIIIAGQAFTITQLGGTTPCSYAIAPTNRTHGYAAATNTVSVTAGGGCAWTVSNTNSWINFISGTNGMGNSTLVYSITANPSASARSGHVQVAGLHFVLTQDGGPGAPSLMVNCASNKTVVCGSAWSFDSPSGMAGCAGTNVTVRIVSTVTNNVAGACSYQLIRTWEISDPCTNRATCVQVVTLVGTNAPVCAFVVTPTTATHHAQSSTGLVSVTATADCFWNVFNTNAWISVLSGTTNSGSGIVRYSVTANANGFERAGIIRIAGESFLVTQSASQPVAPIVAGPADRMVAVGSTATFSVTASGTPPFTYQWQFNGVNLMNGGGISGVTSPTLVLANVQTSQAGSYRVVVANTADTTISSVGILTVTPDISLAEALDTVGTSLFWTNSGSWFGQTAITHDGVDAASSGTVSDSSTASLRTFVTGPGTLTFWWKVSSEANNDSLRFYMNGTEQLRVSGEMGWQQRTVNVPAGIQALQWNYTKNSSLSAGQDRGWVDQVQFIAAGGGCTITLAPSNGNHGPAGAISTVNIIAEAGCAWSVTTSNAWITILSPISGAGSGIVNYSVPENSSTVARSGNINIGGQSFLITQSAAPCSYTLTPMNHTFGPNAATGIVTVATSSECAWRVFNTNAWIAVANDTNVGSGLVRYTLSANLSGSSRSGNIFVAGQLRSIIQSGTASGFTVSVVSSVATVSLHGDAGSTCIVERSEDLIHWIPISTNTTPCTIVDPSSTNAPIRFYRTLQLP